MAPAWRQELDLIDHRPYTTGFYAGDYTLQEIRSSKAPSRLRVVGVVRGNLDDGRAVVDVKNPFSAREILNVLPVKRGADAFDTGIGEILNLSGQVLERAQTNRLVILRSAQILRMGDLLRRVGEGLTAA